MRNKDYGIIHIVECYILNALQSYKSKTMLRWNNNFTIMWINSVTTLYNDFWHRHISVRICTNTKEKD